METFQEICLILDSLDVLSALFNIFIGSFVWYAAFSVSNARCWLCCIIQTCSLFIFTLVAPHLILVTLTRMFVSQFKANMMLHRLEDIAKSLDLLWLIHLFARVCARFPFFIIFLHHRVLPSSQFLTRKCNKVQFNLKRGVLQILWVCAKCVRSKATTQLVRQVCAKCMIVVYLKLMFSHYSG